MDLTASNPKAASLRIEPLAPSAYKGQRAHDLRRGPQPAYVDGTRGHLNRVLVEPPTPGAMVKICQARRAQRATQRAMKRGSNCAFMAVITFGAEAQVLFSALEPEEQDAAYREVADRVAERMNTTVSGLVVHGDESAPHAHAMFPAYDLNGEPLTKSVKRGALFEIQDIVAEVMGKHAPGIERGRPKLARIEAGAKVADTIHRTVKQLHMDLPAELAAKQAELAEASARVDEMRERVEGLEAKADLTDKETKRLETYRKRLTARVAEEETAKAEAERLAALARDEAAQAVQERDQARTDEEAARAKAVRITSAIQVLADEITGDTISRDETGKVFAKNPAGLKDGFPDLRPAVLATADAMTTKRRKEAEAEADRQKAAEALKQAHADAETHKAAAVEARAEAEAAKAEVFTLRDRMKKVLGLLRLTLSRVEKYLTKEDRAEAGEVVKQADRLLNPSASTPEDPVEKPKGSDDGLGM